MSKSNTNGLKSLKQKLLQTIKCASIGVLVGISLVSMNRSTLHAAPSATLNFQARLLSASGAIVPDGNYHVEFKLYNVVSGGSALWTETRTTGNLVSVKNGYLSVYLGSVTALPSTVDWNEEHWLTMNIGGASGSPTWDGEMTPRIKLTAVPYAFQAGQLAKSSGSDRGTLAFGSVTNNPQITLPNDSGEVCLDSGNCGYGTGDILNGGQTGPITIGTNNNSSLFLETNNVNRIEIQGDGDVAFNSNTLFVDAVNGRVGIGTATPGVTLDVVGNVDLSGHVAIGDTASVSAIAGLSVGETYTSSDTCTGYGCHGTLISVTANNVTVGGVNGLYSSVGTSATAFTLPQAIAITAGSNTAGAGSTITNNYGLYVQNQTAGTNDYGIYVEGAQTAALWVDSGATILDGTLELGTLGTTNTDGVLCRNGSNQLAACNSTFLTNSTGFIQNGNSFGAAAVLGTNDAQTLSFETGGITRITVDTSGNTSMTGDLTVNGGDISSSTTLTVAASNGTLTLTSSASNDIVLNSGDTIELQDATNISGNLGVTGNGTFSGNLTVDTNTLFVNATTNRVGIGNTNPGTGQTVALDVTGGIGITDSSPLVFSSQDSKYWTLSPKEANNKFELGYQGAGVLAVGANGWIRNSPFGGTDFPGAGVHTGGSTATLNAWGTNGVGLRVDAGTYTNDNTAAAGTATNTVFNSFATPLWNATNAGVITTNAATVYIQGAPALAGGSNDSITNAYSLWIDAGATRLDGTLEVGTLGTTNTDAVVCRNSSNQLAACSSTFLTSTTGFIQNGNSFGTTATLGTNDAQSLAFETGGTTRLTITTSGDATLTGNLTVQGTGSSSFAGALGVTGNLTVDSADNTLNVNATNNSIGIRAAASATSIVTIGNSSSLPEIYGAGDNNFNLWSDSSTYIHLDHNNNSAQDEFGILNDGADSTVLFSVHAAGQVRGGDGTAGAPTYSFNPNSDGGSRDTGMYLVSQDVLGFSTAGTKQLEIGATGNTTLTGNLTVQGTGASSIGGTLSVATLGTASNATYLCRNGTNQIAACNTTGNGAAFVQGGNAFGATAVLGTTDSQALNLVTGGASNTRLSISAAGNTTITGGTTGAAVTISNSTSTGNILTLNDNSTTVFSVADGGAVSLVATQANALRVQSASAADTMFTVDTSANRVKVGNDTGTDAATTLFVVDGAASAPSTVVNGAIFYNSATNQFQCGENGLWSDCGSTNLQQAYNNDTAGHADIITTDNKNIVFTLADTTTDSDFVVNMVGTGNTFEVQDGGTAVLTVADGGAITTTGNMTIGDNAASDVHVVNGTLDINNNIAVGGFANVATTAGVSVGALFSNAINCSGAEGCIGVSGAAISGGTPASDPQYTGVYGAVGLSGAFTAINGYALRAGNPSVGAGAVLTNSYGLYVANMTSATNDYGVVIEGADTYALWSKRGAVRMATTNSTNAFQLQNGDGATLFSLDASQTGNLAANGGAETAGTFSTNWTTVGTASAPTQDTTNIISGTASVSSVFGTAAGNGVRNNLASNPATSTNYIISFTALLASGTAFTDLNVRYSPDGGTTTVDCANYSTQTLTSTAVKVSCTLNTGGTAVTNADLIIRQPTAAASSRTVRIDNLSMIAVNSSGTQNTSAIRVGGSLSQGLTLLTLDTYAGTPFTGSNSAFAGSMYFDTSQGKIQCYDGTQWGACGAAPDNIVTLTPEYSGAVLNGSGIGTMTADFCGNDGGGSFTDVNTSFCANGEARNFYRWTSPQASYQTYSIYVTYKLPSTFKSFVNGTTTLTGRVDDTTNGGISYQILRSTGGSLTTCSATKTVVGWTGLASSGSANTWTPGTPTTDPSTCSFAANDYVVIQISATTKSNANAYVENLQFRYSNQ